MIDIDKDIKILYKTLDPLDYASNLDHYKLLSAIYLWCLDFPKGKKLINIKEEKKWYENKFDIKTHPQFDEYLKVYLKEYSERVITYIDIKLGIQKTIDKKKEAFSDPLIDVLYEISGKLEKLENDIEKTSKGNEKISHVDIIKEKRKRRQTKRKLLKNFCKHNSYKKSM